MSQEMTRMVPSSFLGLEVNHLVHIKIHSMRLYSSHNTNATLFYYRR